MSATLGEQRVPIANSLSHLVATDSCSRAPHACLAARQPKVSPHTSSVVRHFQTSAPGSCVENVVRYTAIEIIFQACGRLQQCLKFRPSDIVQRQEIALHRQPPYTFANSSSSVVIKRSTSDSLTMSGGKKRSTVSIVQLTRKPRSRQSLTK